MLVGMGVNVNIWKSHYSEPRVLEQIWGSLTRSIIRYTRHRGYQQSSTCKLLCESKHRSHPVLLHTLPLSGPYDSAQLGSLCRKVNNGLQFSH